MEKSLQVPLSVCCKAPITQEECRECEACLLKNRLMNSPTAMTMKTKVYIPFRSFD